MFNLEAEEIYQVNVGRILVSMVKGISKFVVDSTVEAEAPPSDMWYAV